MKGGVRKKVYSYLIIGGYVLLPFLGWVLQGFILTILGICLAFFIDIFFPTWKWELTWKDFDIALENIYIFGNNPCELGILIDNKTLFVYRDELGTNNKPIRMSIRLPVADWAFLFENGDFNQLVDLFGGKGMYHKNRGLYSYGIFPQNGVDGCKQILRFIINKSEGEIHPYIYAKGSVNSKKNIWIDYSHS